MVIGDYRYGKAVMWCGEEAWPARLSRRHTSHEHDLSFENERLWGFTVAGLIRHVPVHYSLEITLVSN
jgi:hypothetical protein